MSRKNAEQLKQLKARKAKLQGEIKAVQSEKRTVLGNEATLNKELSKIQNQINALEHNLSDPVVSDHAMMRFLERSMGLDVEQMKKDILPDETVEMIKQLGNGKYPIGNGCRAVVQNNTVVTITD